MESSQIGKQAARGSNTKSRVKVAIRVRPMISKELMNNESSCIEFKSDSEIVIDGNRSYKFDRVFREDSPQVEVYNHCIRDLVLSCFDGYNAAVLAYGQTGSGKTFSMGTSHATLCDDTSAGIIPRVIREIFTQVAQRKSKAEIHIKASFLEIYNEQIIDLLVEDTSKNMKNRDTITIQERDGSVNILGVLEEEVTSADQMIHLLDRGGYQRTTASTFMNEASSRSHAIFTIFIQQTLIQEQSNNKEQSEGFMTAKFFFVDLAGSQRAKKTGATGATLRQGININLGLLQLGNVISALATIQKKHDQFITFRNSKLTRMLQDCLGGNSNTYMIACVSPAESNVEQSLNSLKYASKAMNIKNTPIVNRDPQSALIAQLRHRIFQLQSDNRKCKQILNSKGVTIEESNFDSSDQLVNELKKFKDQNRVLAKRLGETNIELQAQKHRINQLQIKMYEIRREKDLMQLSFEEIVRQHPQLMNSEQSRALRQGFACNERQKISVLQQHLSHIQQLQMRLVDRDKLFTQLQLQYSSLLENSKKDEQILIKKNNLLYTIGRENARLRSELTKAGQSEGEKGQTQVHAPTEEIEALIMESEMCEQDEEMQQHESNYVKRQQEVKLQMDQMDQYILEREQFLQKMSRQQIGMETELINSMKHEYDDKIMQLERERRNLLKQKDESSVVQKNKFFNKIENLENQLKDYRKKAKQQKSMEKLVQNQNHKIKDLAEEIKKFKMQKMELFRKLKEDKDNFDKLKSKRVKELLTAKKDNLKKDSQIRKLTLDNFKKQQLNRKKDQEIKKIKRVNDTLKSILRPNTKRDNRESLKQSNKDSLRDSTTSISVLAHSLPPPADHKLEKEQEEYLSHIIKVILSEIDREQSLAKYQSKLQQSEKELQLLLNDDSIFRLKLQRIRLKDDQLSEEQQTLREQLELNVADLKERIDLCEEGLAICKSKYSNIFNEQVDCFDIDAHVVFNRQYEDPDRTKALLRVTFASLKNLLFENHGLIDQQEQSKMEVTILKQQIGDLRQQLIDLNGQYHRNLVQMREEMMANREQSGMEEVQFIGNNTPSKRGEERQRRELEKKIQDLSKANRQVTSQLEKTRRKCEVVQEKYQNIKSMVSKDKNIGRQDEPLRTDRRNNVSSSNISNANTNNPSNNHSVIQELDGMLQNIDRLKKTKSIVSITLNQSQIQRDFPIEKNINEEYSNNRWECIGKIDAHGSSVLSIAVHSNFLISTATKSLKIWDLQTRKIISQLSGPNLAGSVKFVTVDPQRRLFFTACDKTVTIWDLITLQVQGTLKCHKDEVRAIHICGDYLFTGGKGTANGGSLLVWDLRKLNPNQALQQKQKNQDIFTMASRENILFYGTRNHSVRRMNINSMDILSPFEPPHLDSVTGLAVIGNKLVSGSKDKNLRLWSLDHSVNNARHTLHLFNDYVNTVTSPPGHAMIYAGSKDGQVKVCYTRNERIEVFGGILAHTQSVNSLCSLDQNPYCLVTGSQDRTIKIWQPNKETTENLVKQDYF